MTPEEIAEARRLREVEGWSYGKLATRFSTSKNVIVGHANRGGWKAPQATLAAVEQRREGPRGSYRPRGTSPDADAPAPRPKLEGGQRALLRFAPPVPAVGITSAGATAQRTCQWIAGDPQRDPTKCGLPSVRGCSWCEDHRRRAFTTDLRQAEEEAA